MLLLRACVIQGALHLFQIVDVGGCAEPLRDGALLIAGRHGAAQMPAILPRAAVLDPILDLIGVAAGGRRLPGGLGSLNVVGMKGRAPTQIAARTVRQAGVLIPPFVEIIGIAVRADNPHHLRHGVSQLPETTLAVEQGLLAVPFDLPPFVALSGAMQQLPEKCRRQAKHQENGYPDLVSRQNGEQRVAGLDKKKLGDRHRQEHRNHRRARPARQGTEHDRRQKADQRLSVAKDRVERRAHRGCQDDKGDGASVTNELGRQSGAEGY